MFERIALSLAAVLCLSAAFGCGHSDSAESGSGSAAMKERCAPGTVYTCGRWNCTGHQLCSKDSVLSPCMCDAADGGETRSGDAGRATAPTKPHATTSNSDTDAGAAKPARDAHDAGRAAKPEVCDNGRDDDGDGKVDCADSDCGELRCIDAAPSGWQGPVAMRSSDDGCKGAFDHPAFEAGADPEAAPAKCSACSCQGSCAAFVDFQTSPGAQCGAANGCSTSVNGNCVEIAPQCLQAASMASLQTSAPESSCTASEQHSTLASASWKTRVTGCRATAAHSGGCGATQQCLPARPGDDFQDGYCIWREGDEMCPRSSFSERSLYYLELDDTRECSACTCAANSCKYSWKVFDAADTKCERPVLDLSSADQCAQVNPVMGKLRVAGAVSSAGPCSAGGGESRGGVAGAKPVTVCCTR